MISHGEGFVIRHVSGRYFNSDCYYPGFIAGEHDPSVSIAIIYRLVANPFAADLVANRESCGRFLTSEGWREVADQFEVVPGPGCACCGERWRTMYSAVDGSYRCEKHLGRNPCAIEGCKRTCAAEGRYGSDQWLCSEHWRRFVPPHSPMRRAYHRFFREAKKHGWGRRGRGVRLDYRFRLFWTALVRRARRAATEGHLDETEINRMFGWEDA